MRWTTEECPFPIPERGRQRKREIIHPPITTWDDFSDEDKKILTEVKDVIYSYLGECELYIYGSRVTGVWDDESDYDIIVFNFPDREIREKIINHNFSAKIDVQFRKIENPYISVHTHIKII